MTSLSALATLPALPVQVAGKRAEKSPRLTAVTTFSMTRGSIVLSATTLVAMGCDSSPLVRPRGSPSPGCRRSLVHGDPEFDSRPRTWLTLDSASAAGQLRTLTHRDQPEVARHIH